VNKDYVQFLGQNAGGITADYVNIRAGAGIHHTVLGQLTKGQQIYIQEELDKWYRIEPISESYGWVSDDYLAFKSEDTGEFQYLFSPRPYIEEGLPEPEVVEDDYQQEYPVEEIAEKYPPQEDPVGDLIEGEDWGAITVTGIVEPYEDRGTDRIFYKIVENDKPVCYVQGVNNMLGRFVNLRVKVEGTVNQKLWSRYEQPVITVYKIRLTL